MLALAARGDLQQQTILIAVRRYVRLSRQLPSSRRRRCWIRLTLFPILARSHTRDTVKIKLIGAAVLAVCWVGPAATQTVTSAQWQRKAEAAVAAIRGTGSVPGLKEAG